MATLPFKADIDFVLNAVSLGVEMLEGCPDAQKELQQLLGKLNVLQARGEEFSFMDVLDELFASPQDGLVGDPEGLTKLGVIDTQFPIAGSLQCPSPLPCLPAGGTTPMDAATTSTSTERGNLETGTPLPQETMGEQDCIYTAEVSQHALMLR